MRGVAERLSPLRSLRDAHRAGRAHGRGAAAGFSLVEVILASFVLVVAIMGAITTLSRGYQALDTSRSYGYASQVMQSEMERLRLYSWDQLTALQQSGSGAVTTAAVPGAVAAGFSCVRSIRDVKPAMKQITLTSTWSGHDGRTHTARMITEYSQSGLYDYFYTAH